MMKHLSLCFGAAIVILVSFALIPASAARPTYAAQAGLIEDLEVRGNRQVSTEVILKSIKSRVGEHYNRGQVRRDFKAVLGLGFDPKRSELLVCDGPRGGKTVIFNLSELPGGRERQE